MLLIGYPALSYIRFIFFKIPILRSHANHQPVSIIVAAYMEDRFLRDKLMSLLDPDEWIDGSEIIIVLSGATNTSLGILEEFKFNDNITPIVFPHQVSKIQSVNLAASLAKNEILVFSDCRQKMKKGSIKNLISNFADSSIGTVVATLKDSEIEKEETFFRRLLTFIARCDSQAGSALNVYGALYAQRKKIFRPFPENIIFDDLFVVVSTLSQNQRLIQEENAIIYDVSFNSYYRSERIQRLARGLLLFLVEQRSMFLKIRFYDLIRLLIFKYLKLLVPFILFIQAICISYYAYKTDNLKIIFFITLIAAPLLVISKCRNFLALIIRINYHFMLMTIKFVFLHERSTTWKKLQIE
jgi:cellulose synthase/poly-beta-1,6-N-acetylglucosamine synthase-like glycosyltransferase